VVGAWTCLRIRYASTRVVPHSAFTAVSDGCSELLVVRQRAQRCFWASAMRCRPIGLFGPVDSPPWLRQRPLAKALRTQGRLVRVLAEHRALYFLGMPKTP
jgi:hypothetical protein